MKQTLYYIKQIFFNRMQKNMQLKLIHAGRYDYEQRYSQITHAVFIGLNVSGLVSYKAYSPSGKYFCSAENNTLTMIPPGTRVDFAFNNKRENFVLICDIPDLAFDSSESFMFIRKGESNIQLQPVKKLDPAETLYFRSIFERVIRLKDSPVPANIFLAEAICGSLLAEFAVSEPTWEINSRIDPVVKYKDLIDKDLSFSESLHEHCRKLGYSPEHLRRCFIEKFGIEPREYRLRRRLDRIFLLLNDPELTVKEIADAVGMKSVTHLHAFLRQRCGMTPGELQKKLPH